MREDIKNSKYRKLYNRIDNLYCQKHLNVTQSCKKCGITPRQYYRICKYLNEKSVADKSHIMKNDIKDLSESEENKSENITVAQEIQSGGENKNIVDIDKDNDAEDILEQIRQKTRKHRREQ